MDPTLEKDLAGGGSVMVKLAGKDYPLAYPMRAVILYRQETAKLNRARGASRPRLSTEETQSARNRFRELIAQAQKAADEGNDFSDLIQEATFVKLPLDEDAGN